MRTVVGGVSGSIAAVGGENAAGRALPDSLRALGWARREAVFERGALGPTTAGLAAERSLAGGAVRTTADPRKQLGLALHMETPHREEAARCGVSSMSVETWLERW